MKIDLKMKLKFFRDVINEGKTKSWKNSKFLNKNIQKSVREYKSKLITETEFYVVLPNLLFCWFGLNYYTGG